MDLTKEILKKIGEYETFNQEAEDCNYVNKIYWQDLAKDLNDLFALHGVIRQSEQLKDKYVLSFEDWRSFLFKYTDTTYLIGDREVSEYELPEIYKETLRKLNL